MLEIASCTNKNIAMQTSYSVMCILLQRVTEATNVVKLTDRMWARLLASTNQPSFLNKHDEI